LGRARNNPYYLKRKGGARLLSIKLKINGSGSALALDGVYKNKSVIFKDSYLFLPSSLRILVKSFG
jgi:hypothetical protein